MHGMVLEAVKGGTVLVNSVVLSFIYFRVRKVRLHRVFRAAPRKRGEGGGWTEQTAEVLLQSHRKNRARFRDHCRSVPRNMSHAKGTGHDVNRLKP